MPTTIDNTRVGLLRAVIESPWDDGPRLVMADWLDEHGETDRAELVRVQCELAKLGPPRKRYERVDSFTTNGWKGFCMVEGEPVAVGDRIDLVVPDGQRGRLVKVEWFGVLVTALDGPGSVYDGRRRNGIDWRVDEHSRRWPGDALRCRECELLERHYMRWGLEVPGPWTPHGCKMDEAKVYLSEPDNTGQAQVVFRRGFPAAVTLPATDFLRDGIAGAIAMVCPVVEIALSDKRPIRSEGAQDWRWCLKVRKDDIWGSWELPAALFDILPHDMARWVRNTYIEWGTESEALAALGRAAVRLARAAAGLPELTWPASGDDSGSP